MICFIFKLNFLKPYDNFKTLLYFYSYLESLPSHYLKRKEHFFIYSV